MQNIFKSLIDDYGTDQVTKAAKQLLDQEQNKRAGNYHELITPEKLVEDLQLVNSALQDVANAGQAVDDAYANRSELVKRITQLETNIELDEAEAFMMLDGNKAVIDGKTTTLSNDKLRDAYRKYVTRDLRTELADLEADLKAIEIDIFKAKERQDEARQSASILKARLHVQANLLKFLSQEVGRIKKEISVLEKVTYTTSITVDKPDYMSDEEFSCHLLDAKRKVDEVLGTSFTFSRALSEMGFKVTKVTSNKHYPDNIESTIQKVVDVPRES